MQRRINILHFFLVDYTNSGSYYWIGLLCDNIKHAEKVLQGYFRDVRYKGLIKMTRKNKQNGNRKLDNEITIKYCKYAYELKTYKNQPLEEKKVIYDNRHQHG